MWHHLYLGHLLVLPVTHFHLVDLMVYVKVLNIAVLHLNAAILVSKLEVHEQDSEKWFFFFLNEIFIHSFESFSFLTLKKKKAL